MNRLFVMRHAQADWTGGSDFERPLTLQGERDATAAGQLLRQRSRPPQMVLASAACRAKETAERVAAVVGIPSERVHLASRFYGAPVGRWIEAIAAIDPAITALLVVGHNPTISRLIATLTDDEVFLHPADFVDIDIEVEWALIGRGTGTVRDGP